MICPDFNKELELFNAGYDYIIGLDEVGKGAWAGPVVAGATIFKVNSEIIDGVRDSKLLQPKNRENLAKIIQSTVVSFGIGAISNNEIDTKGITLATEMAMKEAIFDAKKKMKLNGKFFVLVDGRQRKEVDFDSEFLGITSGDKYHYSISSASIIAKVFRDKLMVDYDPVYPGYGFEKHKGYGTKLHQDSLLSLGVCEIHRISYKPVRNYL